MAPLTSHQLHRRRQVEAVIRLMAPALDALLFLGDRLSRVAGRREDVGPAPHPRALPAGRRTRIGGPPA